MTGRRRPAAPWRTLRGRLVLAAVAGLLTAAIVFAAVGAGLIRSQSQAVARGELDRQARDLEKSAHMPDLATYVERQRELSPSLGGKTV